MLTITGMIWGGAFIAGKISTQTLSPVTVAFLRFFGASLLLFPMMWMMEPNRPKPKGKQWISFAILGFTGIFLYNICFFYATKFGTIIKSSLVIAVNGPLIALLSVIFLKEKLSWKNGVGMLIAAIGAVAVITDGNLKIVLQLGFERLDLILIIACVSWAAYSVIGKTIMHTYSPLTATTYATGFGTLFLFPFAMQSTTWESLMESDWKVWTSLLYVSLFVTVLSFIWWYKGIQKVGAAKSSVFINIMPLSASIMAVIFFHERLNIVMMLAGVLIICGVYLSTKKDAKPKHERR